MAQVCTLVCMLSIDLPLKYLTQCVHVNAVRYESAESKAVFSDGSMEQGESRLWQVREITS